MEHMSNAKEDDNCMTRAGSHIEELNIATKLCARHTVHTVT